MRNIFIVVALLLSGCSMSLDEVESRVKWCESKAGIPEIKNYGTTGYVETVICYKHGKKFSTQRYEEGV